MTEVICFVTVVILQASVCRLLHMLAWKLKFLGRIAQSSLCPWDLNFLSVLYHYAAGLRSKLLLCDT